MPTKRLTAAMVERIRPPAKGQVEYWDKNMPGLALRVSYNGTKAWTVLTRLYGKVIRVTLGEWPTLGLADAQTEAREAKRQAKAGIDPREQERQQQTEAEDARKRTFEAMTDLFLERYASPSCGRAPLRNTPGRSKAAGRSHGKSGRSPASAAAM